MQLLTFDTDLLPPEERLRAFKAGAVDFDVSAEGDPRHFATRWQLLKLGDVNAIRSTVSPVHYRRDRRRIEADGEDRVAIHYYLKGGSEGELASTATVVAAGSAAVWDLAHTLDMRSVQALEVLIVTLPRYLLDEVLGASCYSCVIPEGPELALAADQLAYMLDHAADLPDETAPFLGRAVRDLFAVAMLPALEATACNNATTPLFRRIFQLMDAETSRDFDEAEIAVLLDTSEDEVRHTLTRFGGLSLLVERRRLLAAYRLLCDPSEDAPIATIARRCGFLDVPGFSRRFRSVFQASPSELRRFRHGNLPHWAGAYHVERNYRQLAPKRAG